ncbi:hypothetical protein PIB30_089314 [Stylosanthes scabra]|uniref:Uncharacterized protein n=1 Tax=Stylosanthes scabra TaxID=79078 RepID=A0ABU6WXD9_9FABA|nr:hypothetical protein [Stylosanthes scabra]
MILPSEKTKDQAPSSIPSDLERQRTQGKVVASDLRKRNTQDSSKGLFMNKSRQVKTTFVNRESSPVDVDEEDRAGRETSNQALSMHATHESTPPHVPVVAQMCPKSKDQDFDLGNLLSQAKQVYSSGGKTPLREGTRLKKVVELEAAKVIPSTFANLAKIAAKILPILGLPLEELAANDQHKADLISAISALDDELPPLEASFIHQFGDFISGLYSASHLALADRKTDLDAVVDGWKLLCRKAVGCSEDTLQISQVLEQGNKSEQEAVSRIKTLEDELAAVRAGLANIKSTNDGLLEKLKRYGGIKTSMASAVSTTE